MSDLKYQDVAELRRRKAATEKYIDELSSKLSGQKTRLEWINRYIYEKTPQELTYAQVEARLGHKLIIKPD